MVSFVMILVGMFLLVAPWVVGDAVFHDSIASKFICSTVGAAVLLGTFFFIVMTRLYRRAAANQAFVRTGQGGAQVILDRGALFISFLHQIIPVSLETMRLNVERRGPHALITKDNLRVDLSAEFYIKVQANREDILQAARSLGGRSVNALAVSELVQEKLVSALRTVAATKDLVELHSKRDEFAASVQEIVTHDLSSNGLTLESVTISSLDQTDTSSLQEHNVFDAQGLRKISEITQRARVERNNIERAAEREVVNTDVDTRKRVLDMKRDEAEFEAEQKMKVANIQAGRVRETQAYKIEQDEAIARREIDKVKALELTEVKRRLEVEQSEQDKQIAMVGKFREREAAEIQKTQAIEVAHRAREVAIAQKEQERALAQAAMLAAEADKESASQKVITVKVTAEAGRDAEKKLIAAKQTIQENKIRQETEADVMAYMEVKQAEAERQAADLQYEAKLRLAEGDAKAAMRRAEGDQAIKMVDVTVDRERVNVEQARVEVERTSLSNKQEFEDAALKFELEKLRIDAERDVRIKSAEAMGNMMSKAQVQIFGDPETMTKMSQQFLRATSVGVAADGLLESLPSEAREFIKALSSRMTSPSGGNGHGNGTGANANDVKADMPAASSPPVDVVATPVTAEVVSAVPSAEPAERRGGGKPAKKS